MTRSDIVQDKWSDGWDFCDAVREASETKLSMAVTAALYAENYLRGNEFPGGYDMDTFVWLDACEGRHG